MEASYDLSTLHQGTLPHGLILPKPSLMAATTLSSDSSASTLLSFPSVDLELISLNSKSYTSLKDILPTSSIINSPTTAGCDIPIRNRLVKQAAWAYLQPMSPSPSSSTTPLFQCLPFGDQHFLRTPINSFFRMFDCGLITVLTRAFHLLLMHLRILTSRNNQ